MKWTASLAATATVERLRVGVADVLRGEAHQPARDVERILAGLDHPRQPVDRGVRDRCCASTCAAPRSGCSAPRRSCRRAARGAADGLRDARGVDPALRRRRPAPRRRSARAGSARRGRRRWRSARSPRSASSSTVDAGAAEAALAIGRARAARIADDCRPASSGLQHEDLRARQQRRVDLERRVLGGRADQHDVAGLDARQEGVLLRLVEAVDLVDEDDGAAAACAGAIARPRPSPRGSP